MRDNRDGSAESRPDVLSSASEAVVLCTRNRPEALARTLGSVAEQRRAHDRPVVVVDGSEPDEARRTAHVVRHGFGRELPFYYHRYTEAPAGARQRNAGVDLLPATIRAVHFIDDDVTLRPGYFEGLCEVLNQRRHLLGVGGIIAEAEDTSPRPRVTWKHRLFLLRTNHPSRVLPSGQTTPAWPTGKKDVQPAAWLSTCASSYRAEVFDRHRFDPAVEGPSPRLEDLDFSVRVARDGPLAVVPEARCVHRVSDRNRRDTADTTRERLVRRYWFVQKNMDQPLNRLAFWWSVLGQLIALVTSSRPDSRAALQGHVRGLRQAWTRAHPLLGEEAGDG
ncbi:glycosyltransferase family 2 protein [Salinibacter grassmerensis]|uniref:glycosyltransferase family 2 protein n=1 Tax=Salinibacter grassmerensis TaxID=3040353 RepID=UPI0021E6E1C4|nr:glycosyltransferase [Salinibacter grassmerensis]